MRTATVEQISELIASLKALRRKVAAGERRAEVASSARGDPAGKGPPRSLSPRLQGLPVPPPCLNSPTT
jgi:hypothetical protein